MNRLLLLLVCCLATVCHGYAYKSVTEYHKIPEIPAADIPFKHHPARNTAEKKDLQHATQLKYSAPTRSSEDSETVKVTFKFPALGVEWKLDLGGICVYNEEGYDDYIDIDAYDDDWELMPIDTWEYEIPAGTYEFLAPFSKINPDSYWGEDAQVLYIVENVEVKEGTVVELKPEESTICLTMTPKLPNGEDARFRVTSLNEDWSYDIIEEGNIADDIVDKFVIYKGSSPYSQMTNGGGSQILPGPHGSTDPYANCNVYVNKVSDAYTFQVIHFMQPIEDPDTGVFIAVTESLGAKEGVYTNGEYLFEESQICHTPISSEYPLMDEPFMPASPYALTIWPTISSSGDTFNSPRHQIWKIWSSGPSTKLNPDDLYYSYSRGLVDASVPVDEDWSIDLNITTSPIFPLANPSPTLCINPGQGIMRLIENGDLVKYEFPGNPAFMSLTDNVKLMAGESAPHILTPFYPYYDEDTDKFINVMDPSYKGYLDEEIETDLTFCEASMTVNGKEIATNLADVTNWMYFNPDEKGEIVVKITTDNFEIDGIKGGNHAVVSYNADGTNALPPTLTMVQLRNKNNQVAQVFATPGEGKILLSAADMEMKRGEEADEWGYVPAWAEFSQPEKVTVTVQPTGVVTESYETIELTVHPELFYTPGFGAFYTGELSNLTQTSPTGWFDMTISVEDAAGNRQVQTLSPAFKVESLVAGVNSLTDSRIKVVGNNIITPDNAKVYNLNGLPVNPNGLPVGIYFVVLPERTVKVLVK